MTRLFAIAFTFLLATAAAAQTGAIGGFVSAGGTRAGGATVTVQSGELQLAREVVTSRRGHYWVPALPAGTYDVTFSLPKHQTLTLRAEVREGEQTRVDGRLEPSEDEESVTRTGGTRSVGERSQLAWTLDRDVAEALPLDRMIGGELALAPGAPNPRLLRAGGVLVRAPLSLHRDAVHSAAVVFGAPSADVPEVTRVFAVLRNGGEETAIVRSTLTRHDGSTSALHEVSFGTPLSESIWTFLSAAGSAESKQVLANADLSPTARDTATLTLIASDLPGVEPFGVTWTHANRRLTAVASAGNTSTSVSAFALVFRSHEIAAGYEHLDDSVFANSARDSGFVRDRWAVTPRVVVEAGVRAMAGVVQPRAGAVVDVWSDLKLAAAWSRSLDPFTGVERDETMLSLARPFASAGYARAAFVRTEGPTTTDALLLDAQGRYLLFAYGATVALEREGGERSRGAAWLQIDLPTIGYDLGLAAVERWRPGSFDTDLAFRWALDTEHFEPFAGIDVVNVFERESERLYRVSLGLRR